MLLYPENIEAKLGFDTIRGLLNERCLSSLGRAFVARMAFSSDYRVITKLTGQVAEFVQVLQGEDTFPQSNYLDVTAHLKKAEVEGAWLTEEEFHQLNTSLATLLQCQRFFKGKEEHYPMLCQISGIVKVDHYLLNKLQDKFDEKGLLRNNASPELASIRSEIQKNQSRLRIVLNRILRSTIEQGYANDDVSITIRGGRMVIPILAEHKRRIKGFIHDESATGQTVYLEPAEVLDINNSIRELEYSEHREVVRILTGLTDQLRPFLEYLYTAYRFLGMIDFIRAKALLAGDLEAILPAFEKKTLMSWQLVRHPLLYLAHKKLQKPTVPFNLQLDAQQRILIISGPNAGGKSVTLKTVGLVQYMFQCGLLVPMEEGSTMGVFQNLFIDIGDEQSIENDLSTYSSHLRNMRYFAEFTDKKTLFLIDEFGTGTEPQFGGAIAESILIELNKAKGYGVINTHYANLKKLGEATHGLTNGAMRYDLDKLEPLYELEMGKPGSSFALEIARKIGLPKKILEAAKGKVGYSQVKMERLLGSLESERTRLQTESAAVKARNDKLETLIADYTALKERLEGNRKDIINNAKAEAQQLLSETNRRIEHTIREIRETNAEKERTRALREELKTFEQEVKPAKPKKAKAPKPEVKVVGGEIAEGSKIRIKGQDTIGEVLALKGRDATIVIGDLKSTIKLDRLEKITTAEFKDKVRQDNRANVQGFNYSEKAAEFSGELDIRGKRAEEALGELDAYIDQAVVVGFGQLRIIHGKGNGVLKDVVRNHLRHFPQVVNMADDHADRGGHGVTVVTMA